MIRFRYLKEPELREEGGTPAIVETIRAGLAVQLKEAVGADFIMEREKELCQRARERLGHVENIEVLGGRDMLGLPVISFMVRNAETGQVTRVIFICRKGSMLEKYLLEILRCYLLRPVALSDYHF